MPDLSITIASGLAGYYEKVAQELHKWVDPISQEQLWRRPYPYGNSVGHLLLHVTGNLNYYIGARIAETGYVRDRDREFSEAQRKPKAQLLQEFDHAISMVVATIRRQTAEDWMAPYSAEREAPAKDRFTIFVRCAGHAYHPVVQLISLCRKLTKR